MSLVANLSLFLSARHWHEQDSRGTAFRRFVPPAELDLGNYYVVVPRAEEGAQAQRLATDLLEPLASIYSTDTTILESLLATQSMVISLRQHSRYTFDGSVPVPMHQSMMDQFRKLLLSAATFVSNEDPVATHTPEEAKYYLSRCAFLQSSRGSYVTHLRLPTTGLLAPTQLRIPEDPGEEPKAFGDVNDALSALVPWTYATVFNRTSAFSDSDLPLPEDDFFSVDAIEHLATMVATARIGELGFSFHTLEASSTVESGELSAIKVGRMNDYARRLRSLMEDLEPISVVGQIVELRSRNPDKNRNHIYIRGRIGDREGLVAIRLPRRDYSFAVEAHGRSQTVYATGLARRMKTQFRITRLTYLSSEPPPI